MKQSIAFVFLSYLNLFCQIEAQLRPGGAHVCQRTITYNAYESRQFTRVGYENYRTCCKRFLGACTSRCTRSRSKVVHYTNSVLIQKQRIQYYCCAGWAKSGDQCPLPICNPGCKNGKCTNPNVCSCNRGFVGNLCETDINECTTKPCDQICTNLPGTYSCSCRTGYTKTIPTDTKSRNCKDVDECKTSPCKCAPNTPGCSATCHNFVGSFTCSCNSGFQLTTSKQICVDINECSSSATNNCQQQCINSPGTYTCSCKSGFLLLPDKRSCKDINECSTLNGGCSQICTNQLGSYQCSCKRGFRLSNDKKTCMDINECTEQKPCDNRNGVCTNIRGSYQCSCKVGYKMLPDKKTCKDIDECKEAHSCQHNCTNTDGSYLCSCALGFRLHADRSRCDDIDECNEGTDKCQHRCHNTIGSYTCSCRAGYKRENDKISCQALPCQTVSPPAFGKMNCSGYATDESCNISCNTGFNLDGPKTRKCQPSTIWSGDEPKCERKQCPKLRPPMHGSVLLPCNEVFDAVCLKKCSRGFYMQGERKTKCIMKTDSTVWTDRNTTCIATRPCSPNPCLHDGKCTETSKTEFLCDCDGTGYTGTTCSIGIIKVSMFPQLSRNVTSPDCYVVARPAENLVIKLINVEGSLIFTPDIMHIRYPETSTKFTVKASKIGIFKISYRLLGESSSVYKSPPENIVYVFESESTRNVVDAPIDFFKNMCPNDKRVNTFTISSTCGWNSFGTGGFVSLKKDDIRLPLSIVGMENLQYEKDRITSANLTKAYLESKELTECMKPCNVSDHGVGFVDYMIKYKYFPTIFFYEFSSMLPYWLDISLDSTTNSYEAENMFMEIVKGHDKEKIQKCLPKSILVDMNHNYALYLPTALFNFKIMASSESIQDVNKVCFMVDLNTDTKYMMFKRNIDYTRHLKTNGIDVKTFKISSITFEPTTCGNATCEKHNVRMDAELKYFFKSFSGSVTFNGEFTNTDSTKFMIAGFSSQIEVKFYGNISMDLDAKFLGNVLSINTKSMETNSTISFQGETSKVVSVMPLTESNFKYTVSSIRFLPKTPSIIDIPLQVNGGLVTNIRNINMMQLLLRSSTFIRTAITKIENLLVTKYPREYQILYKRKVKLFLHIGKVSKIINKNPADIQNATLAMKDLKLAFYDTRSLIQFMMAFFQNIDATDIVKQCRIADGLMNKDSMLQVIPNRTLASLTDTDWYLKYTGDICIYSLCFENVNIKARYPSDAGMGNITVESKFRENRNLSKRVFVVKDNTLILQINKNKNSIQGYFNASVKLFGHFHRTKILLTESKLHFQVQISFQNNLKFTVQNVKDITKVTWDDVISQITGWSLGDNKNLQDYIQNYYQETSTTTKRRLNRVKKRKEETSQKYSNFIKRFSIMKTTLQEDMKLYRVAQATYKQNLIKLNGSQIRMLSYMKSLGPTFIEKNLTGICTMKTCEKQCIAMPECQVCQDEVTVPVKVLKCDQRNENIKSSVMVPVETMCDLTKYFFIPIYTGDCEEDPAMANYRSQQMKEYIGTVQRGSTVGALIGSIIPGIGTVLGGFIGGIVGAIGGLFSSCDESYEVITKKKVIQTPCTLTKLQVQTVQRPVSTCYYIQRNIKSGYSEPKECNCKLNDCITRVAQTSCLVANMNCQNRRSLFLKSVSTIPKAFTDLHELVQKQKNNVQISFTDLQRLTKRKEFTQHEYDRIHGMLKNSKQESLFANTTESSVQNLISKDVCLAKKYDVESKIKNLFEIRSLSFEGTVPFVDNIQINAAVYVISTKTTTNISFVYDLNDGHLSLQAAAKRIIHSVLCSKSRRQRSVAQYDQSDDNSFTSWYIDENLNATTVQLACMTFEKTTSFLQDTLKYLINITKQAIKLKRYINQSSFDVSAVNVKSADSVTKSIATFFNSLQSEIGTYANRSTVSYVLTQWKETSEIFTLNNNFTVCFGFQDCVESAFYSLEKLPTILSSPRQTYDNDVCVLHVMWMAMFMKSIQNSTLSILLEHSLDMKNRLSILQKMSHHCDDPPVFVKKNLIEEDIHAKIGSKFTLKCGDITSSLPVKYNWKLHDQFLDEEASQTLEIDATLEKRGVYTCVVSSPVGSVSSKGVFVDVYQTPVFVSEMKDIVLYLPIGNDTEAYFTCNVTSSPRANIYWYHQNYEMSSPPVLLESNKSVLSLEMFDVTKSGFYYCKANNTHGEIMSNKSKLDVLKTVLPKHVLKMSVDVMEVTRNSITVPLNSITKGDFKPLAEKIRMSEQQQLHMQMERHDLKIKLAFEIQVESTAISSNSSISSLLKASSKSRQDLANSAAALVIMILQNQSTFAYDDNVTAVKLDNNSLTYELKLNICLPGYELHKNGFLCGQCRAGWYSPLGGKCTKCSEGKYQSSQGKTKCLECTDGRTTSQEGSMNKYDCELTDTASKFSKKEKIALIVSLVLLCIIFIFVGLYIWYRRKSEKKTLKIVSSENRENDEPSVRRNPIYDVSYQAQTILSNTSPCDNEAVGKVYLKDCEEKKSTEDVKCYENTLFTT